MPFNDRNSVYIDKQKAVERIRYDLSRGNFLLLCLFILYWNRLKLVHWLLYLQNAPIKL